jgi:hypothetical protein
MVWTWEKHAMVEATDDDQEEELAPAVCLVYIGHCMFNFYMRVLK